MSVIGQAAGIEHGSMRGYRQHTYRKVPATEACGCLKAVREDSAQRAAERKGARPTAKAWNGGMTGTAPARPQGQTITRTCPKAKAGCGVRVADTGRPGPDMVRVAEPGSREPARWYCPGACAGYGQALAEVRALPDSGDDAC